MYDVPKRLKLQKIASGLYNRKATGPSKFRELVGDSFDEQIAYDYMRSVKSGKILETEGYLGKNKALINYTDTIGQNSLHWAVL
jgi:hypothetical protein